MGHYQLWHFFFAIYRRLPVNWLRRGSNLLLVAISLISRGPRNSISKFIAHISINRYGRKMAALFEARSDARNELHPHGRRMESRLERPIGRAGAVSQTDRRKFSANEALRSLGSPLTTPVPALRLFLSTLAISFHHNARRKCLEERTEQIYTR